MEFLMKWHNVQKLLVSIIVVSLYPAMAMAAPSVVSNLKL